MKFLSTYLIDDLYSGLYGMDDDSFWEIKVPYNCFDEQ
jgi:hypothetical protein